MEWKDIPGFPGYQASSAGQIRSLDRLTRNGNCDHVRHKGRVLKQTKKLNKGHLKAMCVSLSCSGVAKYGLKVHRLVLLAFVGPCPDGLECCHNDGNPANNSVDNLRWDTYEANRRDAKIHGTLTGPKKAVKGIEHFAAKLTPEAIKDIRACDPERGYQKRLAVKYGVHRKTIVDVLRNRTWTHV